jgi:hypothetical protein
MSVHHPVTDLGIARALRSSASAMSNIARRQAHIAAYDLA